MNRFFEKYGMPVDPNEYTVFGKCKNTALLNEIIFDSLPEMFPTQESREYALAHPRAFNCEYLVEMSFERVGGIKFIDGEHADFIDGTDSKTASVSSRPVKPGQNSHRLEISNIVTAGGNSKSGALRVVLYNPLLEGKHLRYYFVPQTVYMQYINRHPTTGIGRMFATYNRATDCIPKLDGCEVSDFETLAKIPADYQ